MGERPLQLRRLQQQLKYAAKSRTTENHPAAKVFEPHWTTRRGKYNEHTFPIYNKVAELFLINTRILLGLGKSTPSIVTSVEKEGMRCRYLCIKKYSKKLNPETVAALGREKIDLYRSGLKIFTDASKTSDGKAAAAFCVPELNAKHSV